MLALAAKTLQMKIYYASDAYDLLDSLFASDCGLHSAEEDYGLSPGQLLEPRSVCAKATGYKRFG